jgi:hypothetical protein
MATKIPMEVRTCHRCVALMNAATRQFLSCGLELRLLGRVAYRRLHHRCQAALRPDSTASTLSPPRPRSTSWLSRQWLDWTHRRYSFHALDPVRMPLTALLRAGKRVARPRAVGLMAVFDIPPY